MVSLRFSDSLVALTRRIGRSSEDAFEKVPFHTNDNGGLKEKVEFSRIDSLSTWQSAERRVQSIG